MSKVIQLGLYALQFGNREYSIYKRWCGLQPDFVPVGPILCVMFGDAARKPRGEASVWLATEVPDLCTTPTRSCFGRVRQIRVANDRRSLSALLLDDRPIPTHSSPMCGQGVQIKSRGHRWLNRLEFTRCINVETLARRGLCRTRSSNRSFNPYGAMTFNDSSPSR